MKDNREQSGHGPRKSSPDNSIGNIQGTTQTGGQNAGGENIDQEEDQYTEDLRKSGDRNSSNRKNESETGR
jgi:hypothetical protein